MKKGKTLNSLEAFKRFGTMKLPTRIKELPLERGERIVSKWVLKGKRSYKEYSLKTRQRDD
jgi:hypothetical protein